ncbi:MAG: 2,5-diamino-6-(ribosylamino)-4(3H)-pyrimidinone 5'-phosphate reductase [Halobacteriaceae archaeon]
MHVRVNAATSADGKLASHRREQVAISGDEDFARVDGMRAESDAVMVGVGTVLADDPHLTVAGATPARVVADSRLRTPRDARILDDAAPTYLLASEAAPDEDVPDATVIRAGADRVALPEALDALEAAGVESLLVEGGGELIFSLFEAGLVDDLSVFVGGTLIGGRDAPTLADGEGFGLPEAFVDLSLVGVERLDDGVLLRWTVD